ncbi:class I SAM-dependent DNA methyltransferase [Marinactinospora thermotolerans]|uniref:Dimethyladenosine transferase (rRNA methylation) n=1 Tax=Marinactinospora thermotolerans DSM 45154 TaxID=1122192 RepID=A0A1T4T592_9ACTN|nr:class I SAM-dependent methyltransferase [Marinactinospora thermotolerans]SKA35328.1 Dimethyladenosine transferase (rRNA methylation) [Marinactinospora thermotolerans DSM 45154]
MEPDFDPSDYGSRIADIYDATVKGLPTEAAVACLAKLSEGGPVLEFGVGTGRLALPLVQRGIPVAGIEGSPDMAAQLRAKPGGRDIPVHMGDFSQTRVEGEFALVLLALNTVFALPSQEAQVRCFANAAAHLREGGRFVVEAWTPDSAAFRDGKAVRLLSVAEDEVVLEAAQIFPADQYMRTTKVRVTSRGVRLLPANHRYAWPAELDLMARLAGLELEHRWSDWHGTPFADTSREHVTVYRRPC